MDAQANELLLLLERLTNHTAERQAEKVIFDAITALHPTLEQTFWRLLRQVMYQYDELPAHYFDARNEASKEFVHRALYGGQAGANLVGLPVI